MAKWKYVLGVALFSIGALWSLWQAWSARDLPLVALLISLHGYLAFMVADRLALTEAMELLLARAKDADLTMKELRAFSILQKAQQPSTKITHLEPTQAFKYVLERLPSVRTVYNTSFSTPESTSGGDYYHDWLEVIVDSAANHKCIIHEVMASAERMRLLQNIYRKKGAPKLLGSYLGYDLSSQPSAFLDAPFVEFIALEDDDGSREVIFGWTTRNTEFFGSDCFLVRDRRVIDYFLKMFERFERLTLPTTLHTTAAQETSRNGLQNPL